MDRERITISIKKSVLEMIDKTIDGINIRNRSHAIEHLTRKALVGTVQKNAVILLGGEDALKRLPATEETLKFLKASGFDKVYIAVGFLGNKIESKLGNGSNYGLSIVYLNEGEGTAGAILPLRKFFTSTFLVVNSGNSYDYDLNFLYEFHKKRGCVATLITKDTASLQGLYFLEPKIFQKIPKGFSMLEDDIFPKLSAEGDLTNYLPL